MNSLQNYLDAYRMYVKDNGLDDDSDLITNCELVYFVNNYIASQDRSTYGIDNTNLLITPN